MQDCNEYQQLIQGLLVHAEAGHYQEARALIQKAQQQAYPFPHHWVQISDDWQLHKSTIVSIWSYITNRQLDLTISNIRPNRYDC